MKVSLNWLKKYTEINISAKELCDKMTMAGFEVEGVEDLSAGTKNVVVGKIVKLEKHPDADKLQICQIDIGDEVVQIVTGADNVFEGAYVPAALDNSLLPTGKKITSGKLRGIVSNGMLCSGEELMLTEEDYPGASVYGILILQGEYPLGMNIMQAIGKDDCIIDFSITPNRPDCQSVLGMAREIAAVLGVEFKMPEAQYVSVSQNVNTVISAEVQDQILCPRYMLMAVRNVKIEPSPKWLADCLISAGLRPINNIVDITNFIMLETGHPMHAFDARDISGNKIVVRRAVEGEKLVTLDEKEHVLSDETLVIADNERAVGLAGIMGGMNSQIKDDTTDIIFECAKFKRDNIRKSSRKLGIRTDSSSLFEKGVDACGVEFAIKRAVSLVCQLNAGEVLDGAVDITVCNDYSRTVSAKCDDITRLLGIDVPSGEMVSILNRLGINTKLEDGVLVCDVPSWRDDIEHSADLAEEIIRIYGYDKIIDKPFKSDLRIGQKQPSMINIDTVRSYLKENAFHEIYTYSFISRKAEDMLMLAQDDVRRQGIVLLNPLGEDYSVLRTQLVHSMLNVVSTNTNKGVEKAKSFETSVLHLLEQMPITEQPNEVQHVCLASFGNGDFYELKAYVEGIMGLYNGRYRFVESSEAFLHPYRQAEIIFNGKNIGFIGQVHPVVCKNYAIETDVYVAQINIEALHACGIKGIHCEPLPKFPSVQRDLAVIVDENILVGDMIESISKAGGALLKSVRLFDIYRSAQLGENKKSTAFSLEFRADDRTLTVDEVAKVFDKILRSLEYKIGAKLR